jgi:glycerol-3-phosphate dehydrogenase subunit C
MKVGAELFGVVKESGCQAVATECGTCRLQIAGATGAECRHPVSLLRSLAGR